MATEAQRIGALGLAFNANLGTPGLLTESFAAYAAAGTNQLTATTVSAQTSVVNSGTGGVTLPSTTAGAAGAGLEVTIVNLTTAPVTVYPFEIAGTVNGGSSVSIVPNEVAIFVCGAAGPSAAWYGEVGVGFSGSLFTESANNTVAAAGTTQAAATPITAQTSRVSSATAGTQQAIALPLAAAGLELAIINDTAVPITVFAQNGSSDNINDTTGSTGVVQMPNSMVIYSSTAAGKWYAEGLGTGFAPTGVNIETSSATDAISAAGTNTGTATPLTTQINRITTNAGTPAGVTLPAAKPGMSVQVTNATATSLVVYGNGSDDIQTAGGAAAATLIITTLKTANLWCASTGHWHGIVG